MRPTQTLNILISKAHGFFQFVDYAFDSNFMKDGGLLTLCYFNRRIKIENRFCYRMNCRDTNRDWAL